MRRMKMPAGKSEKLKIMKKTLDRIKIICYNIFVNPKTAGFVKSFASLPRNDTEYKMREYTRGMFLWSLSARVPIRTFLFVYMLWT